ncbi:hypothetical protein [Polaribacter sp. AHE13PA]|uniref:hypothetical protein n=1 Tax=Polaribacter sp. AHE13PA TaxID=2745562 RepID=UPI001C4FC79D|nr:hypothetical protein [Polaribacter sp. AHE13PA]QXP68515.1 hypothetical protein H0I28_08530 [Polaribacter sp. AHE13PA]
MLKNLIYITIFFTSFLSFSQNIKSIAEFKKVGDSLIKNRLSEFDQSGNLVREVNYGRFDSRLKTYRNKITTFELKNGQRVSEYFCEDFVAKDTCVLRSFSTFEFDKKNGIEKQTKFESDSLIRFIRETKKSKRIKSSKTYSWEFIPVEKPDFEKALVLIDTIFYDKKQRKIKRVSYNSRKKKPVVELYKYSDKNYTYQTIGTFRDTTLTFQYNKLQKLADKKSLNYIFQNSENFKYEIEYY